MYNKNHLTCCGIALLASLGLTGCGGGGSSSSSATPAPAELEGVAAKGIMADAIVRALRIDTREEIANTRTNADGSYQLKLTDHTGPVLLTAETDERTVLVCDSVATSGCGRYDTNSTDGEAESEDDNGNGIIDFGERYQPGAGHFLLHSYVPEVQGGLIKTGISPLTHTVWKLAESSGDLSERNHRAIHNQVNNLFGVTADSLAAPIDMTAKAQTPASSEAVAHSAIVAALASWAYRQPDGFQAALDRLAETLANGSLVGDATDTQTANLRSLMDDALLSLEYAAARNPGWRVGDLVASFNIRRHIGENLGANLASLPKPSLDYEGSEQDRLAKGRALIADLRTWARTLLEETSLPQDKYSDRIKELGSLANALEHQQPLLDDAYRLFARPSKRLLENVWRDLFPCLNVAAYSLASGQPIPQLDGCPDMTRNDGLVTLEGMLRNQAGISVSNVQSMAVRESQANDPDEARYTFSGTLVDEIAGVSLAIDSATWAYRLKPGETVLSNDWNEAQDQLESSLLDTRIVLSDNLPTAERTSFTGTWRLAFRAQPADGEHDREADALLEGNLSSPNGSLQGRFEAELNRGLVAEQREFDGGLLFSGAIQSLKGEIMEGALAIRSQARQAGDGATPLSFDFNGSIIAPDGNRFDGLLRVKSQARSFDLQPVVPTGWWGGWQSQRLADNLVSGLDLVNFSGKVSTPADSYQLLSAHLDIHNPGRFTESTEVSPVNDWSFETWGDMLEGTRDRFALFSASLLIEENIPGRTNSWVSIALDRTGFAEGTAQLRLSSNHTNDWRSLAITYRRSDDVEQPREQFQFSSQNGATLDVNFRCNQSSEQVLKACSNRLEDVYGNLYVEGQDVGDMEVMDNRLVKISYIDNTFETLQ